jgi:putative two-component system response regulator
MDFGSERIMVVDDEPGVRRFLARAIRSRGYVADESGEATEALDRLKSEDYAVVLADIRMPGHDGIWLLDHALETDAELAVIMVTANADTKVAVKCLTRGATHYVIKPVKPDELLEVVDRAIEGRRLKIENRVYREELERLVDERTADLQKALEDLTEAKSAVEGAYRESIYRLATAAEYRDEETGNHIHRIGQYSRILAEAMGCDGEYSDLIELASPMHDVGKIGVRDSVLLKPGPLTPAEFDEIKRHTVIGGRILSGSASMLLQLAEEIALNHHERWDGSGYPEGKRGKDIPLGGRIAALADVFDALTSNRVYRPAYSIEHALRIIEAEEHRYDPEILAAFHSCLARIREIRKTYGDKEAVISA